MRKKLIIANWKMNPPPTGWDTDNSPYRSQEAVDVIVLPTALHIRTCVEKSLTVGAQCGRPESKGPFTGDISMELLAANGSKYVLCGHSERRINHGESIEYISEQMKAAIASGLHPILCIGETAKERAEGKAEEVVKNQLASSFSILNSQFSIAYEPVWAINTGNTASPEESQKMHGYIRSLLPPDIQETTRIIYGGSVKPENAAAILAQPDIDGALVGASSLDPNSFSAIINSLPS